MNSLNKSLTILSLGLGLVIGSALPVTAAEPSWFQEYPAPYGGGLRGLVDRTQSDLRAASELEHGNQKERQRYKDAQGHLSTFDRHLTKGHFDKGELDKAIESIKGILDKNVLQASSRDDLLRDLDGLRAAREHRY